MEITTERCLWKLLFLNYEHMKKKSLQLKQYPWKVTVKDFILSKVASLQSAALQMNSLTSIFQKNFQFLGMPF